MSIVLESHDSLPYIDPDISGVDRDTANTLISRELRKIRQEPLHPSLQPHPVPRTSKLPLTDADGHSSGQSGQVGIDRSRYEAPDEPALDDNAQDWHRALRSAYISSSYLSARTINLSLLEELGKNAWLVSNSQLDEILKSLVKESDRLKEETEAINRERKALQESSKAEIVALDDTWKRGVGQLIEVQLATDRLRQEIQERQRAIPP